MNLTVVHQVPDNPHAALENRHTLDALGVTCIELLGPAGCGKTTILESIIPRLRTDLRIGVLEGDLASTCDAQRIGLLGVPVVQVLTDGACHLNAAQVQAGLAELPLGDLDLVFVENIGSPICPPRSALGEHLRIALLSVAGGDQTVRKYPGLYRQAALVLLTKFDLAETVDFDVQTTIAELSQVAPNAEILRTDTRRRLGIDRLAGWLLGYVRAQTPCAARIAPLPTSP